MESNNINSKPGEIKITNDKPIGLRRPATKSLKNEVLKTSTTPTTAQPPKNTKPTLKGVKSKLADGIALTHEEMQVLLDDIKKTETEYSIQRKKSIEEFKHRFSDAKYEFHDNNIKNTKQNGHYIISEYDLKRTAYKPINNDIYTKKGGFERAMEKIGELIEKGSKVADKITKLLEYCKKYGKSFRA